MESIALNIRLAKEEDCSLLWRWKNEEEARKSAFDSRFISYQEHQRWFLEKLNSANTKIFIISVKNQPVGQVRLDMHDVQQTVVSISIASQARKKGYGSAALEKVCRYGFEQLQIIRYIANIKRDNSASIKTFKKVGFIESRCKPFKGHQTIEMVLEKNGLS